jgi:hypothetical protein
VKVLINDCDVDIKLQTEKNTTDVGESIINWATERELVFVEAIIDGKVYLPDEIPSLKLDEVKVFNANIQSKADLILNSITEGIGYCDRVYKYIDKSVQDEKFEIEQLDFLYSGVQWLKEMTLAVFQLMDLDKGEIKYLDHPVTDYLDQLDSIETDLSGNQDEKAVLKFLAEKKDFFETFKGIFKMLLLSDKIKSLVIQSVDSPDKIIEAIHQTKEELPAQLENLANVAIAFQEGKDDEGAEKLQAYIDFLYMYIRLSFQIAPIFKIDPSEIVIDDVTFEQKNSDIYQLLNEIVEVMENSDIISLSDILEYEMRPIMENVNDYLDIIIEKIK